MTIAMLAAVTVCALLVVCVAAVCLYAAIRVGISEGLRDGLSGVSLNNKVELEVQHRPVTASSAKSSATATKAN